MMHADVPLMLPSIASSSMIIMAYAHARNSDNDLSVIEQYVREDRLAIRKTS